MAFVLDARLDGIWDLIMFAIQLMIFAEAGMKELVFAKHAIKATLYLEENASEIQVNYHL